MNLELQPFHIVAYSNGKNFRMLVEQVVLNDQYERFCISAGGRSVIIQSDRPSVRESKSKRKIKWQLYRVNIITPRRSPGRSKRLKK